MTYKEATLKTGADTIERIALVLSKRLERAELAAAILGELLTASSASHAILWRRDPKTQSVFFAELASGRIESNESFDAATLGFWKLWQNGSKGTYLVENKDENLSGANWTKYNLLLPLPAPNDSILGILSLHHSSEPRSENNPFSDGCLAQIIANALLLDKRSNQDSSVQLQKELWLEHNHKLLLMRLNSRLDRDYVLQTAVDTLGAILKVSSCLVVRSDSARITHEFVDPELSPLGLGLSSSVPQAIAAQMCERTTVLEETGIRKHEQGSYIEGMESLFESSVRSLAGTPIIVSGASLGALVVQSNKERKWMRQELQLLEGCANAMSQALRNADHYQEVKEQVFNLNLVSNLSRQLSTAVEMLSRHPNETHAPDEDENLLAQAGKSPPLSARELEVLRLIASGLANREIAQRLFLTESTVELHASRIRKKLKLKSRTALVKFACDNHLV